MDSSKFMLSVEAFEKPVYTVLAMHLLHGDSYPNEIANMFKIAFAKIKDVDKGILKFKSIRYPGDVTTYLEEMRKLGIVNCYNDFSRHKVYSLNPMIFVCPAIRNTENLVKKTETLKLRLKAIDSDIFNLYKKESESKNFNKKERVLIKKRNKIVAKIRKEEYFRYIEGASKYLRKIGKTKMSFTPIDFTNRIIDLLREISPSRKSGLKIDRGRMLRLLQYMFSFKTYDYFSVILYFDGLLSNIETWLDIHTIREHRDGIPARILDLKMFKKGAKLTKKERLWMEKHKDFRDLIHETSPLFLDRIPKKTLFHANDFKNVRTNLETLILDSIRYSHLRERYTNQSPN